MKNDTKKRYQDFINHIEFPAILYIYENNRVVAKNSYAECIIGEVHEDIRDLFGGKKLKFLKKLSNGSSFYRGINIVTDTKENQIIDAELFVMEMGKYHLVLMLFDNEERGRFPEVLWKYTNDDSIYGNYRRGFDYGESFIQKVLNNTEEVILKKENQFNSIQMVFTQGGDRKFIKKNTMPIVDKSEECMGLLCIYNEIANKDKEAFTNVIKEMSKFNDFGAIQSL